MHKILVSPAGESDARGFIAPELREFQDNGRIARTPLAPSKPEMIEELGYDGERPTRIETSAENCWSN